MSEVLFLGCFYRCYSACINGLISPRREVQNMLFICFKVVVTKTWNDLKPPKTINNNLQPPQKIQQPPTTSYNHLKNIYNHA